MSSFLQGRTSSLNTRTVRKLEKVVRELKPLADQGRVNGFFNNVENADKLGSLVEDIRNAVINYQVCTYELFIVHF